MSKFSAVPIFSAAHVSKWDTFPDNVFEYAAQSREEPNRATRLWPNSQPDGANQNVVSASSKSDGSAFSTPECETTDAAERRVATMAVKTYTWITLWFLLTAPVIIWDVTYCFMRPRSMVGGDLHWIWEPYGLYQDVDYVYGLKALEENNGFTNAQSFLNLVETALNLAYVYLAHVSSWSGAPLVGFAAATMTLSKTVLYWAQEYYCNGCAVGHNPWGTLLLYWVLPNGLWLVFPSIIVWRLSGDIIASLSVASQSTRRAVSGKMQ